MKQRERERESVCVRVCVCLCLCDYTNIQEDYAAGEHIACEEERRPFVGRGAVLACYLARH